MRMFAPALSPSRLEQLLSLHAESVRKAQGSDLKGMDAGKQEAGGLHADGMLAIASEAEADAER